MDSNQFDHKAITQTAATLADRAQRWMLEDSFPFWAERTPDPAGGFFERLDLNGNGIAGEPSRVRLQARMVFTFSLAAEMGWDRERALELVERGLKVLTEDCLRGDGLIGRLVQPGTGLVDDSAETYDAAFALLAFATATRVFGLDQARKAGADLSQAIDQLLACGPEQGGYRERLPPPVIREQNPHMHLTEASLAWYEATQDKAALARACNLVEFVRNTFFDDETALLLEFSGDAGPDNRCEAGHLFEWVWILGRLRQLSGEVPDDFADALHDGGMHLLEGLDYLPLSQQIDGTVREALQRTWGPTEKLKAHIAHWRVHRTDALAALVVETAQSLFDDHVEGALSGAWIDAITPARQSAIKDITPATGYHIFLAFQELITFSVELKG